MIKYFLLSAFFIFTCRIALANDKKICDLQITYRDTSGTYIQIFAQRMDSEEILKDKLDFIFSETEKKAERTYVTRKEYGKGAPEILSFKADAYNIQYGENIFKNMDIKQNKLNIIILKVTLGKLSFAYTDDRNTKVKNTASVRNRDVYTGTATQDCSETREYKKGNYYVDINTLPPTIFITDIDYSAQQVLIIDKPGKLVIDLPAGVSDVVIYDTDGADWKEVIRIEKAYTELSPLLIQPRMYSIAWMKDNKRTETSLQILPDKVTNFTLKN